MKKAIFVLILILSVNLIFAAEADTLPPFMINFAHSAPAPSAQTFFQADLIEDLPTVGIVESYLAYSTDNWSTKTEITATDMGISGHQTYEAAVTNPSAGNVDYYFYFESDDKWAGQCPLYDGTASPSIPENYMLYCGYDGAGTDSTLPDHDEAEDLDLLEYWFGMSNGRFYGKMRNATGSWHLENGSLMFGGKHVFGYGIAINNPDRPDEDYMYLMAQCGNLSVSGMVDISPGVLEAYTAEGAEEVWNIGDADITTTGDILEISAPISTFTGGDHFGGTTPASGFYQVTAFTMYLYASLSGQDFSFVEATKIGKLYINNFSSPEAWEYTVGGANTAPLLSGPGSDDEEIWVTYTDADNNQAVDAFVSIDGGSPIEMSTVDHVYDDGAVYRCTVGDLFYGAELDFDFSDGMADATMDYSVGIDEHKVVSLPENLELECAPNPFNPAAQISFNIENDDFVELGIYNTNGHKITNLIVSDLEAGVHSTRFDASSFDLAAGVYLVNLRTSNASVSEKIIYIK
ncbi:MAG: T9SS type A sorting domain-containing protein [Candidatus Zixiibacteriota bacterium]